MNKLKETSSDEKVSTEIVEQEKTNVNVVIPLKDLVTAYLDADIQIKAFDAVYEENTRDLKVAKDQIKAEITKTLKDRQEYSARLDKATVTLSVRKTGVIVDEQALVKDLKKQGLKQYIAQRVTDEFESVLKEVAKGEKTFKGVEIKETEFVSIRSSDSEDRRKIVTEPFVKIGGHHA